MKIGDLFDKYGSDKNKDHSYGPVYDQILAPYRDTARAVLEVGVMWGASLRAWRDFFPRAWVWGADVSSSLLQDDRITSLRLDSCDEEAVATALIGLAFDVIIDDGDHHPDRQAETRNNLWAYLRPGGLYVIEDVQWYETHDALRDLGAEVHDLRHVKGRMDDVLAVFRKGE